MPTPEAAGGATKTPQSYGTIEVSPFSTPAHFLDRIQRLHTLRGDAYVTEAATLGLLVTESGTRLDVGSETNTSATFTTDEAHEVIQQLFARHGEIYEPDDNEVTTHSLAQALADAMVRDRSAMSMIVEHLRNVL